MLGLAMWWETFLGLAVAPLFVFGYSFAEEAIFHFLAVESVLGNVGGLAEGIPACAALRTLGLVLGVGGKEDDSGRAADGIFFGVRSSGNKHTTTHAAGGSLASLREPSAALLSVWYAYNKPCFPSTHTRSQKQALLAAPHDSRCRPHRGRPPSGSRRLDAGHVKSRRGRRRRHM